MTPHDVVRAPLLGILALLVSCSSPHVTQVPEGPPLDPAVLLLATQFGLEDIRSVAPDVVCDLRYRTTENITNHALYPANMPCLLYSATAAKLRCAQDILRAKGYGLKVWDAWRPAEVQMELYRYGERTGLFVDPEEAWSFHCSGTAVDVTLVDPRGRELTMPTPFDTAGRKASITYQARSDSVRRHVRVLQEAMSNAGFSLIDTEWWHFDDGDYKVEGSTLPVIHAGDVGIRLPKASS
jgi:zinc D-Ala-D-Ala dipeptidase